MNPEPIKAHRNQKSLLQDGIPWLNRDSQRHGNGHEVGGDCANGRVNQVHLEPLLLSPLDYIRKVAVASDEDDDWGGIVHGGVNVVDDVIEVVSQRVVSHTLFRLQADPHLHSSVLKTSDDAVLNRESS